MSIEAMKQALEALENAQANFGTWWLEDITALRAAIEQAERQDDGDCKRCGGKGCVACDARCLPEYAPPQRQPLNLNDYINDANISAADMPHTVVQKLQAAIERAHGIGGEA
jgi:hypothetical protein